LNKRDGPKSKIVWSGRNWAMFIQQPGEHLECADGGRVPSNVRCDDKQVGCVRQGICNDVHSWMRASVKGVVVSLMVYGRYLRARALLVQQVEGYL